MMPDYGEEEMDEQAEDVVYGEEVQLEEGVDEMDD
jgi:hypothetical protein